MNRADQPFDVVEKPQPYNAHPSGVEAIELCELLSFNVGNAVKYLFRCVHKGAHVQDLKKARWYIRRAMDRDNRLEHALRMQLGYPLLNKVIFACEPGDVLAVALTHLEHGDFVAAIAGVDLEISKLEARG